MAAVAQRVFLNHAAHHHKASEGAFGVIDEGGDSGEDVLISVGSFVFVQKMFFFSGLLVYYESLKRELKTKNYLWISVR